jgi:hypothetical protein
LALVALTDSVQGELFGDDYSQPDANDGDPVFWCAGRADGVNPLVAAVVARAKLEPRRRHPS